MSQKKKETPGALTFPIGKRQDGSVPLAVTAAVSNDGETDRLPPSGEIAPGQQGASARNVLWTHEPREQDPTKPDEEKT